MSLFAIEPEVRAERPPRPEPPLRRVRSLIIGFLRYVFVSSVPPFVIVSALPVYSVLHSFLTMPTSTVVLTRKTRPRNNAGAGRP